MVMINDRQALLGKDFNDIKTYGMYQDEVVDKEEALYIYNGLLTGDDFYGDKLSFDPRELAPLNKNSTYRQIHSLSRLKKL
jgi:hypothetical protein